MDEARPAQRVPESPPVPRPSMKSAFIGYWILQASFFAFTAASYAFSTTSFGGYLDWLLLIAGLPCALFLPYIVFAFVVIAEWRKPRTPWRLAFLVSLLLAAPLCFAAIRSASLLRMRQFAELAERTRPLTAAIRAFEHDNGGPPPSLEALVPAYIPAIPGTGLEAYPAFRYLSGKKAADQYWGNPWVLHLDTSEGALDFDYFYYLPLQNYPERQPDGHPERIGDWVYLHE